MKKQNEDMESEEDYARRLEQEGKAIIADNPFKKIKAKKQRCRYCGENSEPNEHGISCCVEHYDKLMQMRKDGICTQCFSGKRYTSIKGDEYPICWNCLKRNHIACRSHEILSELEKNER